MIELKRNVVMFTILTVGAVYFLYEDLRKVFTPTQQVSTIENVVTEELQEGYIGRKLLALNSNMIKDSLEVQTELNPFVKSKMNNDEKGQGISKGFVAYNKLGRNRLKKLRRRKRNARHNDFGWKLSLNVTNNKNLSKAGSNLGFEDDLSLKSRKENFLNMAIQMEGASPDKSYQELHEAWDSLGLFLRRLYGNVSFKGNDSDITAEIITETKDVELPDPLTEKSERERKPKFLFGLLNFGNSENPPLEDNATIPAIKSSSESVTTDISPKFFLGLLNSGNSENPPLEANGTTLEIGSSSEIATSQKPNVVPMEKPTSIKDTSTTTATEPPIESFGLEEQHLNDPTVITLPQTFMDIERTSSEFSTQLEEFKETSASPIIITIKPEPSFTSEQLKEFCISLLSRIQVSPKSIDQFAEEDGSGEVDMSFGEKETVTGFQSLSTESPTEITTKSTNQRFGIWASIWNRISGRRLSQHQAVIEQSSITPKHGILETTEDNTNDAFLPRESSTVPSTSDSTDFEDFMSDEEGSALTVSDCEGFFRHIQNDAVFSKPNLFDIINNPILLSLAPSLFNISEIQDEKQMRSMRSDSTDSASDDLLTENTVIGLTAPFSSVKSTPKALHHQESSSVTVTSPQDSSAITAPSEHPDKNTLKNNILNQDPLPTLNSFDPQENFQTETVDKFEVDDLITESGKGVKESANETAFLLEKFTTTQFQSLTGLLDDGLFVQSDAHQRNDVSSEMPSSKVSEDINERIFGLLNFGSGERNLEDFDGLSSQNVSEIPEHQSFRPDLINFSSNDSELNESFSINGLEIASTESATGRNIFDVILSLQKEESPKKNTQSDAFDTNEEEQQTESQSTFPFDEKPPVEFQLNSEETPKESHVLDPTNEFATQSISGDQMPLQNIFDEDQQTESKFFTEEKVTESRIVLDSTNMPIKESISEAQTSFQDAFDTNEEKQHTESQSTITFDEKPHVEFQFNSEETPTENHNVFNPTNEIPTQSISGAQMPLQNIFDEDQPTESQFFPEEKSTESRIVLDSTDISIKESMSENQTSFQNVLDESGSEENRLFPGLMDIFGSGDGRELSEIPTDPELSSEFSDCLDCQENKSSSFSVNDGDDCGSDLNDTNMFTSEKESTTINPLSNKIVSDASVYDDALYLNSKDGAFSEFIKDPSEFSTGVSPKSLISSPVPEIVNYENYDYSSNIGYEASDYGISDPENYGYDVINYEHYNYSENVNYQVPKTVYYDNSENIGYKRTNYEYHNYENYGHDITTPQPLKHVHDGEYDEIPSVIQTKAFSESPPATTKLPGDFRFMDTLFLTGSGAGGLFGNDNGEINLVQEPDTTSFPFQPPPVSPRQSRRGGRMDDASFPMWPAETEHQSKEEFDIPQQQKASDIPNLNPQETSLDGKAPNTQEEENRFGQGSISHLTTLGSTKTEEDGFNNPQINEDTIQISQDAFSKVVTAISIPTNSFITPKKKAKDLPPRYCNHAGECNIASNEGCITKMGRGVCDCRRSFVRHPDTDICEAPFMMRTSLRLPAETFHEDLRDKYSELYKNKTQDAIDTMWLVVYQDPTLMHNIADIKVSGFEEGSLVVHLRLIFAVKNTSISSIVENADEKLVENLKQQVVLKTAPLNVENAKLLSFSDVNPCEKKELNYCSKDADCFRDEYWGFRCHCKDGYMDSSKNPMYLGEICIAICPPDYCGENGYCEVRRNGDKECLCNGWYFGERCSVSGILVISCFAGANVVLVIFVLVAVFLCRRRRTHRTRFYESNQVMFQPSREAGPFGRVSPRLAASIALDELGPMKTSKYMAISTPLYMKPDIQITSPSIMGSSISYDYDSTFDRTPSAEVSIEPPKYDSVP